MISIIVPVYNAEQYLHRCIDSILAQSFTDFELLLVNDGSKDASGAICDAYAAKDSRVHVFHKENGGVSSARNLGLDNAKGEYITFCDADDYVATDWLDAYQSAIAENMDMAIQGYYEIDENNKTTPKGLLMKKGETLEEKQQFVIELFDAACFCFIWVKLFRRSIIEEFHIRFDVQSKLGEDAQFIAKYIEHTKSFVCTDKVGYYYNLPPSNKNYKGNSNYSVPYILMSLDVIFEKDIPYTLIHRHFVPFRDNLITNIVCRNSLNPMFLELYRRISREGDLVRGLKDKITTSLILHSTQPYSLASFILRAIHKITAK